jgi:hypothetical protein
VDQPGKVSQPAHHHEFVAGPNTVAAQNLSKMLLTMSSPMPMPAPVTIA